jgi:chorismate--pyruvate lyase
VQPVSPALRRWLKAPGSLTARLRALGAVRVEVMSQGTKRLWPAERRLLRQASGHVREVILCVDGQPLVWARSVTTPRALKGPWKALKGLGTRPLAELLFSHARVRRGQLARHDWRRTGPQQARARRDWQRLATRPDSPGLGTAPPGWARQSVFWHHGAPLRVMESFAPSMRERFTP